MRLSNYAETEQSAVTALDAAVSANKTALELGRMLQYKAVP